MTTDNCTLCFSSETKEFFSYKNRTFYECNHCNLIFQSSDSLCSSAEEKERYLDHNNSELSDGYKKFLYNIIDPVKKYMAPESRGLDFGSGPYPMMAKILKGESYDIDSFDPYFNEFNLSERKYNFVILCEVIEHFNRPSNELNLIKSLLKDGGFLFIQTSLFSKEIDFKNWYYKDDITHVSFFSDETISYICFKYGFERLLSNKKNVIILKSKSI